jgi:hypothetical protein
MLFIRSLINLKKKCYAIFNHFIKIWPYLVILLALISSSPDKTSQNYNQKVKFIFIILVDFYQCGLFLKSFYSDLIKNNLNKSYLPLATQSLINVYQFKILTNTDSNLNKLFKINLFYVLKVSTTPRMTRLHLKSGLKLMH